MSRESVYKTETFAFIYDFYNIKSDVYYHKFHFGFDENRREKITV